ncbi:GNAT family N-acetyltransferase [Actinopolymorpha alba]|uniref:GNAT family N-acetyltransferase n=1 Tax=Actinopolymorpha alba TaxID=533267 RepID=UPI00035D2225|nr:GNAT family N-acetyltransferase [Actinopolymorpha alba]
MANAEFLHFRPARLADAAAVAALHADSWRRHYRDAYSDAFLDGDVSADRVAVWKDRLSVATGRDHTLLAEQRGVVVGFVHTILGEDPIWGALLDNLHVTYSHKRRGIGARLLKLSAEIVINQAPGSGLHLWVLEQNRPAQAFYQALGGACVERGVVPAPGGVPGRLNGSPACLRYAWPEPRNLLRT